MKKRSVIAILLLLFTVQTEAQVTFKPGIRSGINLSKITNSELNIKPGFYVGIYGALKLSKFYTFQPELNYSRQGGKGKADLRDNSSGFITYTSKDANVTLVYFSVATINKFNFNNEFYCLIGSQLDIVIDDKFESNGERVHSYELGREQDIDIGLTGGFGYNLSKKIAIETRIKKGLVEAVTMESNYGANMTNLVYQVGLTYTFGKK